MQNEAEWDNKTDDEVLRHWEPANNREAFLLSRFQFAVERLEDIEACLPVTKLSHDEALEQVAAMQTRPVQLRLSLGDDEQHREFV